MVEVAHAMWVHGTSMQIEYPDRVVEVRRAGSGIVVEGRPGTRNWFHFAIPTPVIVDDNGLRVGSVLLVCRTLSADAFIRDVHVFDGGHRIAEHNNVDLSGDVGLVRLDVSHLAEVGSGVCISIGVGFGVEMMSHRMVFTAAGCDFIPAALADDGVSVDQVELVDEAEPVELDEVGEELAGAPVMRSMSDDF